MRYKVTFAIGFAAGYTLGARAGRERYEQLNRLFHGIAENPAMQSAAGVLQAQASTLVDTAKHAVTERLPGSHPADPFGPGPVPVGRRNGTAPH